MKRWGTRFWIGLFSASTVVLLAVVDMGRSSPGQLTAVHQREDALAGKNGCSACHGGWFSNMTESCLECHQDIGAQIDAAEGLHGAVGHEQALLCATCHVEHHGGKFNIVNKQSFALAGVKKIAEFDHLMVGFEMNGKHLELGCVECHTHVNDVVLEKGARRYLGLDQDCASCHEDPHKGQFEVSCASCHGQTTWDGLFSLGHERQLPLVGGHGDVSCRECHAEKAPHSLEVVGSHGLRPDPRTCLDCHESPHERGFASGVAQIVEQPVAASCVACHAADHVSFRDKFLTMTAEMHVPSGFALDAPHAETSCAKCHDPEGATFAERYPGRGADECSACHADPHGGQFETGPFSGGDCIACHDRLKFEPHAFTVERHARAALPLDGKHAEIECAQCHKDPVGETPRLFRGVSSKCDVCHADAHKQFFAPIEARLPEPKHGSCARCHGTTSFSASAERFDHRTWTSFDILGAHAQAGCQSCHPATAQRDEAGRSFGRVAEHFGPFQGCATCHADVHQGRFDGPDAPPEIAGRSGCARCHDEVSFRTQPYGFDHGAWTDFALVEEHKQASCSACHAQLRKPDAIGRTWGPANGTGCADCHADPHARQFEVAGRNDCERCHTSELSSFLDFDHERDARFPLGEAHAAVACAACHPLEIEDGLEFVRYRPVAMECADCHGSNEEVLLRRKPKRK